MIRRVAQPNALARGGLAGAPDGSRLSKGDQVYLALKRAIVSGEMAPGATIDKSDICDRFAVSRLPVTTAINRLAYERLVLIEPQKGSYVTKIKYDDIAQWMMARRALEIEVVGQAARRLPETIVGQMENNLLYQQAAIGGNDYSGFFQLDIAFHRLLTDGLALSRIGEMLDSLRSNLDRVRRLLLPEPGRMESTLAEHRAIFEAIAKGKPRQAEQAMRTHLDVVLKWLVAFEKQHPDFFGN
jgi:DNA-binding GntR family transcriptional regulator